MKKRERRGWWRIEYGPWTGQTAFRYFWDRESRLKGLCSKLKRANPDWAVLLLFFGRDHKKRVPAEVRARPKSEWGVEE